MTVSTRCLLLGLPVLLASLAAPALAQTPAQTAVNDAADPQPFTITNTGLIDLRGEGASFSVNWDGSIHNAEGGTRRRSGSDCGKKVWRWMRAAGSTSPVTGVGRVSRPEAVLPGAGVRAAAR